MILVGKGAVYWQAFNEKRTLEKVCNKFAEQDKEQCIGGARDVHADRDPNAYVEGEACRADVAKRDFRVELMATMPLLQVDNIGGAQSVALTSPLSISWRTIEESPNRYFFVVVFFLMFCFPNILTTIVFVRFVLL